MSSMINEYWADVKRQLQEIEVEVTKQSLQPSDGCYIISVKNRVQRTDPGVISLAPRKLCAQRLVDGSHRLATDAEIEAYEKEMERKRELARSEQARQRGSFVVQQPTK